MRDYTMGAFWTACIISGISYFFSRNTLGLTAFLINYFAGIVAFFLYMAVKKTGDSWTGEEILAAFFGAALAQWVPLFLCFIFGFPLYIP